MNHWFTARELAGLPGMPTCPKRTRNKLARIGVPSRQRAGKIGGGGLEYDARALPEETRAALSINKLMQVAAPVIEAAGAAPTAIVPVAPALPAEAVNTLPVPAPAPRRMPGKAEQDCADARLKLVNAALELEPLHGVKRACSIVALQLSAGQAPASLVEAARLANQRARDVTVSDRSIYRWLQQWQQGGWVALLPAPAAAAPPLHQLDEDVMAVLGLYHSRDAQFRKLSDAAKDVTRQLGRPFDTWRALYSRSRRALKKVGQSHEHSVALIKSRSSGAQRAAQLPFKRRDTSNLAPLDVFVIDGHTFKAKVRHPDHGAPFAPELTLVMDAATRMICGWSVDLSENVMAVGAALRHAVGQWGVPAILYGDNGAGETAKQMDCPIDGFCVRLGIDHRTGIPGHPQGHGLIERSWQTHAINCARQFGSYQGSDVDAGTFRKTAAALAKEQRAIKRAGPGEVVQINTRMAPAWAQFVEAVDRMVHQYNHEHRHRALPKNEAGKHMTPAEAWAAMFDPALQHKPDELTLRMMFMPAVLRTARRGEVQFFNQHYQAPELMRADVDGQPVSVRYDIHDPSFVMVFSTRGELICEARWNRNRIDYFPKPVVQIAREKRVSAAVKRKEQQIDLVRRELNPTYGGTAAPLSLPHCEPQMLDCTVMEQLPSPIPLTITGDAAQASSDAGPAPGRPFFETPSDRYEWLLANRNQWTEEDGRWMREWVQSDGYAELADYYAGRGLAWEEDSEDGGFKGAQVAGGTTT